MKWKVDEHAYRVRHRINDPYAYWAKLLDSPPKKSSKAVAHWTYVSRLDDDTLEFKHGRHDKRLICLLGKNDTWTVTVPVDQLTITVTNRLWSLTGAHVAPQRRTYSKHENPVRIGSVPYTPGVQVFRHSVVNPEKYVDKMRTLNPKSPEAVTVKQKLQKIRELVPVMVRLLKAGRPDDYRPQWGTRHQVKQALLAEFDINNITALDAERVYVLGECSTPRKYRHMQQHTPRGSTWTREYLETEEQHQRRCVVNGLRRLREHIYSKEGVYHYKALTSKK